MNEQFKTYILQEKYDEAISLLNDLTFSQEIVDSYLFLQQINNSLSIQEFLKQNKINYLIESLLIKYPSINNNDKHSFNDWCKTKIKTKCHYILKHFR